MTTQIINILDLGLPPKFSSFRKGQEDTIHSLLSDHSISILHAPPGSGKTLTYIVLALIRGARCLILTVNKSLQDQLLKDFSSIGLVDVRGHSNYDCSDGDRYSTDDDGFECSMRGNCSQQAAIDRCLKSNLVTTNYALWVTIAKSERPDRLGKFDMIVLDEAHAAHDQLTDHLSVTIDRRRCMSLLEMSMISSIRIEDWHRWCSEAISIASARRSRLQSTDPKKLKLTRLIRDFSRFVNSYPRQTEWILKPSANGVQLFPAWCSSFSDQYLFRSISRVLLSSGTIFESDAKTLGISDHQYLEVPCTFAANRRPFYYIPTVEVSFKMSLYDKKKLVNVLDSLFVDRLDRKGIVHSQSYSYAEMISEMSSLSSLMLSHNSQNAMEIIDQFCMSNPPSLLISPRIKEGIDLIGDLCRWIFFVKVPFTDSRDPLIAYRNSTSKGYRTVEVARSIIQGYFRGMREPNDYCESFMCDLNWGKFQSQFKWPSYFRAAWRKIDRLPKPLMF